MGAALEIHNDSLEEVEVEIVYPGNQKCQLAPDEVWKLKRRPSDLHFYVLIHKLEKKKTKKKKKNWKSLITEYKQDLQITQEMGRTAKFSVANIIRNNERLKRSTAIRQEIMSVKSPLSNLCLSIGERWMACSGALRKRLKMSDEGITYADYKNENRAYLKATSEQVALDLKRTTPHSFRIRNKRHRELENEHDVAKRDFLMAVEEKNGGREKCIEKCQNILLSFVQRNIALGYAQGLNYVVYFLLGFLDEASVFWLLCTLVEDIRLPDFYAPVPSPLNGFQIEANTLLEVAEIRFEEEIIFTSPKTTTERQEVRERAHSRVKGFRVSSGSTGTPRSRSRSVSKAASAAKIAVKSASSLISKGTGLISMLTGRKSTKDIREALLEATDENEEKIGGDLGVLYQKTTEWMIPLFLTVTRLHASIMIIDNFFDLYPDLEDVYSLDPSEDGEPIPSRQATNESDGVEWSMVEESDAAPKPGAGEAMIYCTFLTTMDLIKMRLEKEDEKARQSFTKLFDEVALELSCGDLKHGLECYAEKVGESDLLHIRAKYRNRLADRWNKSTNRLKGLQYDLKRLYNVEVSLDELKEMHEDFKFLYKKNDPGMNFGEFQRLFLQFKSLFPLGKLTPFAGPQKGASSTSVTSKSTGPKIAGRVDVLHGIFHITDMDKGGFVNFKELICILAILCGNVPSRHNRMIFDVFDDMKSGFLNNRNINELARWLTERKYRADRSEEEKEKQRDDKRREFQTLVKTLRSLDKSGNAKLSFTEFNEGVNASTLLSSRLREFKITMKEAKERMDFRAKTKKEKSQIDIRIKSISGIADDCKLKIVLSMREIVKPKSPKSAEETKAVNPSLSKDEKEAMPKNKATPEQSQPPAFPKRKTDSPRVSRAGSPLPHKSKRSLSKTSPSTERKKAGKKSRSRWGPWTSKFVKCQGGTASFPFKTHITLEYAKALTNFRLKATVYRKQGFREDICANGVQDIKEVNADQKIWELGDPIDIPVKVGGSLDGTVVVQLTYKKEWDEEVKRNKEALQNIQALFTAQF